jgi:FkbM family methyltransferase
MRQIFEIIDALGRPRPNGILQVGANNGQEIEYFVRHGIQYAALIEPLDGPFSALQARCTNTPGYLPIQALCGASDGNFVDFHISTNNGESSSMLTPAKHLVDYPWVQFPTTVNLQTFTLDRIFETIRQHRPEVANAIDLLFMDVQGAELHVLKGANRVLAKIAYIYTEVGLGGGYDGAVALPDLIHFLKLYGFDIYELEVNAAGWGNAFFVQGDPTQTGIAQAEK